MAGNTQTTITFPSWAKGLLKYVAPWGLALFGAYIAFHDLQRDFASEQKKVAALVVRIATLETADHEASLAQVAVNAKVAADLAHMQDTLEKLDTNLNRLLSRPH